MLDAATLQELSRRASLDIPAEREQQVLADLNALLELAQQLAAVDSPGADPEGTPLRPRSDSARRRSSSEFIAQSAAADGDLVRVPLVLPRAVEQKVLPPMKMQILKD